MSLALIELLGADILGSIEGGEEVRLPAAPAIVKLQAWSNRYDKASRLDNEGELSAIGREMFAWLDESRWASAWALGSGDRALEIRVRGARGAEEEALLDAPWELLSRADGTQLAFDDIQLFIVARRIGPKAAPLEPRHGDLQLMFMAATPEGQAELEFEAEETAILEATRRLQMRVAVEESGALEFLGAQLTSDQGPFEALHLSCHGDIDAEKGPILLLEKAEGGEDRVDPGQIVKALGADPPPLVVLSACRTAELGGSPGVPGFAGRREGVGAADGRLLDAERARGAGPELATPFVRQLAAKIANVLGWDGSVYDVDATEFATQFYKELAARSPVPRAAAVARQALLGQFYKELAARSPVPRAAAVARQAPLGIKATNPYRGRHWHLARVYVGPNGGGALCEQSKPRRPSAVDGAKLFLDKTRQRVPVATRAEFVGRRREIQAVLRSFRDAQSGVLIHGMGALGKSSLAARVQSRMPRYHPVVIFERYDALAIFDQVLQALEPKIQAAEKAQWREIVKTDPAQLAQALQSWLSDPLDTKPILLIIDDLERILETPTQSDAPTEVAPAYREALAAVLLAFDRAPTQSRLQLTSRYDFRLPDGRGGDLAKELVRVPLKPMAQRERNKQWRAAERVAGRKTAELDEAGKPLLERALRAAAGNSGLQAILTKPILTGGFAAAEEALRQIGVYRETGAPPAEIEALIAVGAAKDSDNALTAFFARVSFATYGSALTPDQRRQLGAATLFSPDVPIPVPALAAVGAANGVDAPDEAIARLRGLGLLDDWGEIDGFSHAAANPLARPLAPKVEDDDRPRLARAAMPKLAKVWRDASGGFPIDPRGVQAAELAICAGAEPAILEDAALSGAVWLESVRGQTRDARELIAMAFAAFPAGHAFGPNFLRLGCECADRFGDMKLREALLAAPLRQIEPDDTAALIERAFFHIRKSEYMSASGVPEAAEELIRESLHVFSAAFDDRGVAFASGHIADILQARGELDQALKIYQEEQLPVFERLGDVRSHALTIGRIADILQTRGEFDQALKIRREDELPVYERLGDARSSAVTIGKIADILQARGELDQALKIYREELLPVFERLGEVRFHAVTMGKIADILQTRGELDQALKIYREEQLPVFERLSDILERAVTMGKIADILQTRGELDQALKIYREEQLPVFERLSDILERAVTTGKIADILQTRGELDQALKIYREEQLPVFERLGDVRLRAVTMGRIADILQARGELDQALKIYREEQLPVFERLGDVHSGAVTMGKIADILQTRGELDQALKVYREEQLPVFERLGDVRLRAVTMGRIADILQTRGELDQALKIRREDVLPVFERLGERRERSATLFKIASGLLEGNDIQKGRIQEIGDALGESFRIVVELGAPDGIGPVGALLAEVLAMRGLRDEALRVLDQSEAAFSKLGRTGGVDQVRELREKIAQS